MTNYIAFIERFRWPVLVALLAITGFAGAGISKLSIDNDYRSWVGQDSHERALLNELEATFEKADSVIYVLTAPASALESEYLAATRFLTEQSWSLPHVTRVSSVINYQQILVDEDDITVHDLVEQHRDLSEYHAEDLERELFSNPTLVDRIVSSDKHSTAIVATVALPEGINNVTTETTTAAKALADRFATEFPGMTIRVLGSLMVNDAFTVASEGDVLKLFPIMYAVFFSGIFLWIRSLLAVGVCWLMVSFSLTTTLGLVGWTGITLNAGNASAPTIILTLVLANCVHIFTLLVKNIASGETQRSALIASMRSNLRPIFLTMVTTVAGFLALIASDSPPYRSLGLITATGVFIAWCYLMVLVPVALSILKMDTKKGHGRYAWTARFSNYVVGHYRMLGVAFGALALAMTACIPLIEINDNPLHYIDESLEFRQGYDFVVEDFFGAYDLSLKIPANGPGGVSEPEYLEGLEKLTAWLRTWDDVRTVNTVSETIKRLNKALNGDDPGYYLIPDNREMISQYIMMYEMSLPYGHSMDNIVDIEKSASKVDVYFGDIDFQTIRSHTARIENWIAENLPAYMATEAAGPSVLFAYITERNIISMAKSTLLCFGVITLIIMIALREWRAGLFSIVANILPLLMAYGFWAIVVTKAGLAISIVAALGIGIIVDDTIHFLSKYYYARKTLCKSAEDAVHYTFDVVGPALIGTSVILVAGFSLLTLSTFEINSAMGLFTAVTVLFAILADFFLLPACLIAFDREKYVSGNTVAQGV